MSIAIKEKDAFQKIKAPKSRRFCYASDTKPAIHKVKLSSVYQGYEKRSAARRLPHPSI